jgi:nickel/cobalt transporter (NicO) family protein
MKLIRLFVVLGWLLPMAVAHPADMLVQAAYITLSPKQVKIELDLTAGESVAKDFLVQLDSNQDQQISTVEIQTLASVVLENIALTVNNTPVPLRLESSQSSEIEQIKLGGGQVQLVFVGVISASSQNQFIFKNNFAPVNSGYLANVFVQSSAVKIISQQRDQTQQTFEVAYEVAESALPWGFPWWLGFIAVIGILLWFSRARFGQVKALQS